MDSETSEQLDFFDPLQVHLNAFDGPLELLLDLIRKHKLDIHTVALSEICQPYLDYMELIEDLNLDIAGEFLAIASTLILIKSRMLLPKPEPVEDDDGLDPEEELRRKLIEYQKYRKISEQLDQHILLHRDQFPRPLIEQEKESPILVLEDLSIYNLLKAYERAQKKIKVKKPHEVKHDENPIEDKILSLMKKMAGQTNVFFHSMIKDLGVKDDVILSLMGILELSKMKLLILLQLEEFGVIHCKPVPNIEEHIEPFAENIESQKGQLLAG